MKHYDSDPDCKECWGLVDIIEARDKRIAKLEAEVEQIKRQRECYFDNLAKKCAQNAELEAERDHSKMLVEQATSTIEYMTTKYDGLKADVERLTLEVRFLSGGGCEECLNDVDDVCTYEGRCYSGNRQGFRPEDEDTK